MRDFLRRLRKNRIKVTLEGDNLKVIPPENFQNNELLAEIKENKEALIQHIKLAKGKTFSNISKAEERTYYPLSSAQRRMYFLYEFDKESLNYNMPAVYNIGGRLDTELLDKVFKKIVDRHEILRTNFVLNEGEVMQKIVPSEAFEVSYFSCSKSRSEVVIKEFIRPFDLSKDYPFRVGLIDVRDGEYILILDQHHIVSDGLSEEILIKDFWSLYNGLNLPSLRLQYKDYAVWQQDDPQQKLMAKDKEFWLSEYKEPVSGLQLPLDHERPIVKSGRGDSIKFQIDRHKANEIGALTQKFRLTPFVFFTSVYTILLNKLSGQQDIVVGTPTMGRNHVDLEGIVGMFVNTIPLRNQVDTTLSFTEYLEHVKECILNCFDHQLYQYDDLVDELGLERDTSRNPLFDTLISYKKHDTSVMAETVVDENDLNIETVGFDRSMSKFDLSLGLTEFDNGFNCSIEYSTDLFKEETIRKYADYLELLISQILKNPNVKLSELTLLSEEGYDAIVHGFNANDKSYDLDQTVVDLFRQQVAKTPDAVALRFHEAEMTYQELESRSDTLSKHILSKGVQNGDVIGICMDRSMEVVIAMLGILKAGCGYLSLDPSQPIARREYQLTDSNASLVITSQDYEETFSSSKLLLIDSVDWDSVPEVDAEVRFNSSSMAYIIYTSGSTGKPKGVAARHSSVVNLVYNQQEFFDINEDDRILQFSPIYFDACVEQIWLSLLSGCALVLIDEATILDHNLFKAYVEAQNITQLHATPSFLDVLNLGNISSLEKVIAAGEVCSKTLAKKYKNYKFYNAYGPTETTVISAQTQVLPSMLNKQSIPIGKPISNVKAYVLDANMKVVPVGIMGELYLSGAGISLGYINAKELTEKSFINNPFSDDPNARLYKTGDVVRWMKDGNLEYFGRKDHQVKIRGYRIELGEIEAALLTVAKIQRAVVDVKINTTGDRFLVGYIISEGNIEHAEILEALRDKLPEYMIPSSYVFLDDFPKTPSGKIDRKVLPIPDVQQLEYVAPTTDIEIQLVTIWASLLDIKEEQIGVTQSFFEIGGHSLKAINLSNKIKEVFSVEIALKDIFQRKTITGLADMINDYLWLHNKEEDKSSVESEIII